MANYSSNPILVGVEPETINIGGAWATHIDLHVRYYKQRGYYLYAQAVREHNGMLTYTFDFSDCSIASGRKLFLGLGGSRFSQSRLNDLSARVERNAQAVADAMRAGDLPKAFDIINA